MADMVDENTDGYSFNQLPLNEWMIEQCNSIGLTQPTPIQYQLIPPIVEGRDCIGCARTGSGKTLAFALPILQKLCEDPYGIFALILTPTRELALQIADQFKLVGTPISVRISIVIGGMCMVTQGQELTQQPHIVIATPGRLADHLTSCDTFSFKKIQFLVLDEADRLLDGGYDAQLSTILKAVPVKRQTILISATITDSLTRVQEFAMNKPFFWESKAGIGTVAQLDQRYVLLPKDVKDGYLVNIIQKYTQENANGSIMIFTFSCRSCALLSLILNTLNFPAVALHSMQPQKERSNALHKFKSNAVRILISTDVGSRGLDIPVVNFVINYNVPIVAKNYIHRVGRTARAGRDGLAVTLVTPHDIHNLHAIEHLVDKKLTEHKTSDKEVLEILTQVAVTKRECEIKLDEMDFDEKKKTYERKNLILQGLDPDAEQKKKERAAKKKKKLMQLQHTEHQKAMSHEEKHKLNRIKNKLIADNNAEDLKSRQSQKIRKPKLNQSKKSEDAKSKDSHKSRKTKLKKAKQKAK